MKTKLFFIFFIALLSLGVWKAEYNSHPEHMLDTTFTHNAEEADIEQANRAAAGYNTTPTFSPEIENKTIAPSEINTGKKNPREASIACETSPEIPANTFAKTDIECEDGMETFAEASANEMLSLVSEVLSEVNGAAATQDGNKVIAGIVEKGDTVSQILNEASEGSNDHYVSALRKVFSPGSFKVGQPYTVVTDPDSGRIIRFEYEINNLRRLVVEGDIHPRARLENIHYSTVLETCSGIIEDNLFQAVTDAGENPQLAVKIANLFGSEINFAKDLQEGDSFAVLHEKKYRNGHYAGYGKILAARFTNKGKTWEAFLFKDGRGQEHYYNAAGENLKKTLLQSPLAVTRLTSKFSHSRKHPILGTSRPHLGVDYGAPTGTPVKAVGDGVVTRRSWNGGYGNQVILRHIGGLESLYSHLSKFASGLKPGQKIRQGQVIGYVGSTGLSTGPHLDFRLKQNGAFINPTKAINPRGTPVAPRLRAAFAKAVQQERNYLDGGRLPKEYVIDMLIPQNYAAEEFNEKASQPVKAKKERFRNSRRQQGKNLSRKRS